MNLSLLWLASYSQSVSQSVLAIPWWKIRKFSIVCSASQFQNSQSAQPHNRAYILSPYTGKNIKYLTVISYNAQYSKCSSKDGPRNVQGLPTVWLFENMHRKIQNILQRRTGKGLFVYAQGGSFVCTHGYCTVLQIGRCSTRKKGR